MKPDPASSTPPPLPDMGRPLDGELLLPRVRTVNSDAGVTPGPAARPGPSSLRLSTAVLAGALVATLSGAGSLEAYRWYAHSPHGAVTGPSPTTLALARLGKDVGDLKVSIAATHQDDATKALKKSVDQLRADVDGLRAAHAAAVAQLTAKLDAKPVIAPAAPALSEVVARLDKLDHDPRLGEITTRLDRIEHQVSSPTPTGSIVPAPRPSAGQSTVTQTNAAQAARLAKPAVLDNWIVRDVYSGIALVEGRSGSIREIVPGEVLPGAGQVRSIERRGRGWIVVTSRGIIDTETW